MTRTNGNFSNQNLFLNDPSLTSNSKGEQHALAFKMHNYYYYYSRAEKEAATAL
jgi:hypothetical protein